MIEYREFRRLGEHKTRKFTGRVVAATNADLAAAVAQGHLRQDLYYRLNTFTIRTPSLRDRPADISLLARYFAQKHAAELRKPTPELGPGLLMRLCAYNWPGNVRELRNAIEALVMTDELSLAGEHLHEGPPRLAAELAALPYEQAKQRAVEAFQRPYLLANLAACDNNQSEAARRMQVSRTWLGNKVKELGIASERAAALNAGASDTQDDDVQDQLGDTN